MIEVEAVHLGAHDVPVNALRDRPAGGVDRGEGVVATWAARPKYCAAIAAVPVIRDPLHEGRMLELAPGGEQRDEVVVASTATAAARARRRLGAQR